jgi:pimeloyl-ACP methyl ester carboxylesterase
MAELTVNGARIHFQDEGRGDPPFVFIHGWAGDHESWAAQVEDLSRDHRCISVDWRGRGGSEAVPPFDTTQTADDLAALIEALGLGPCVIAGHSLGGLAALLLNDRHPEVVLGIVLGDPPFSAAASGRIARTARVVAEAGSMSPMAEYIETFFTESTPEPVKDKVRETMLSCPADVAAEMLTNGEVFVERLDDLIRKADTKPLMAIWGQDPLGDPKRLRDTTVFMRQEPMPGAGHFFQLERPEVTNALLRAFLDDVERDPRIAR